MIPTLFGHLVSPPVRACMMLVRQLQLEVEFKKVDLFKRQHLSPEFVEVRSSYNQTKKHSSNSSNLPFQLTPMHQVPVLKHEDVIATDSHTILMYLVDKFSPDSTLFPKDLSKRTEVLNKIMFNAAYFFPRDKAVFVGFLSDVAVY